MPDTDDADTLGGSTNTGFDVATWLPAEREYGLLNLLMCRSAMGDSIQKPAEVETLSMVDVKKISVPAAPEPERKNGASERSSYKNGDRGGVCGLFSSDEDEDNGVTEGEPYEASVHVAWPGKAGSWWRVSPGLGEDLVVREGLSLLSSELRRVSPGELVQQSGRARALASGRAKGCMRLPVHPNGWVTGDATRAGGPRYLVRTTPPRWRVVYAPGTSQDSGDVIVRKEPPLQSAEVASLRRGDIVEQAGPQLIRDDGIVRMPVTSLVRRGDQADNGDSPRNHSRSLKTLGWVTVDASSAGGPVFFKPVKN